MFSIKTGGVNSGKDMEVVRSGLNLGRVGKIIRSSIELEEKEGRGQRTESA